MTSVQKKCKTEGPALSHSGILRKIVQAKRICKKFET